MKLLLSFSVVVMGLLFAGCDQTESDETLGIEIQPVPKIMRLGGRLEALPEPVYVSVQEGVGKCGPRVCEILSKDLESRLGLKVEVIDPERRTDIRRGTILSLAHTGEELPREGFRVRADGGGDVREITVFAGDDAGVLYGTLSLLELLVGSSLENGGVASAPTSIRIEDYPSIKLRARVRNHFPLHGGPSLGKTREAFPFGHVRSRLEDFARQRMNVWWHPLRTDFPQDNLQVLVDEAATFGIALHGALSYINFSRTFGRPLCPFDPDHMKIVDELIEQACESGIQGLVFLFDDVSGDQIRHVSDCPSCREAFDGRIGRLHNHLIRRMVETGRANGVDTFYTCPPGYFPDWRDKQKIWSGGTDVFDDYFADLTGDETTRDVMVFNTGFDPDTIGGLREAGVRRYIYWINGLWGTETWFQHFVGLPQLAWTWYAFEIGEERPVPSPEAMAHLRNIGQLTDAIFIGAAGLGPYLGGIWSWHPECYDDDRAQAALSNRLYGPGVYEHLHTYETNMLRLVRHYGTYETKWASEFGLEMPPFPIQKSEYNAETLRKLQGNLQEAERARTAIAQIAPDVSVLDKMDRAITYFSSKLERGLQLGSQGVSARGTMDGDVSSESEASGDSLGWWRFEDGALLKDSSPLGNDLDVRGSPAPVPGVSGGAVMLHGGRQSRGTLVEGVWEHFEAPSHDGWNLGTNDSLSVECWVDLGGTKHSLFLGTRQSMILGYSLPGWALGYSHGHLQFVVDDGRTKGAARIHFSQTPFDRGGWNHIVGVRDTGARELRLYVNGVLAAQTDDQTGVVESTDPLRIGYDAMAGLFMRGLLDEIRIRRGVISETALSTCCQRTRSVTE